MNASISYSIYRCYLSIQLYILYPYTHYLYPADIDLIEVNEAFAGQYLAVEKELGLDRGKVNLNGGAIAMGKYCHSVLLQYMMYDVYYVTVSGWCMTNIYCICVCFFTCLIYLSLSCIHHIGHPLGASGARM